MGNLKTSKSKRKKVKRKTRNGNEFQSVAFFEKVTKKCNCRNEKECPLSQKCVVESVVYEALVKEEHDTDGKSETSYIGSTEGTFKQRLYAHKSDMKKIESRNKTALAQHVWDMKQQGKKEDIRCKLLKKCKNYKCGSIMCDMEWAP